MIAAIATVVAALLMWAAFPPLNLGALVFIAPAPFLWAVRRTERPTRAFWLGFLFFIVFFGILLRWIFILGAIAWFPLVIVMGLFGAIDGLLVWAMRGLSPGRWFVAVVGGWALVEIVRARFPFGGFPWGTLGNGVSSLAWPRGAAQWIGGSGWSVVAVSVAAALVLAVEDARHVRFAIGSVGVALVLVLAGALWAPSADGPEFRVAIIQGSTPCPRVHCDNERETIYASHLELTTSLSSDVFDLVLWPENSTGTPTEPINNPAVFAAISSEASRLSSNIMVSGTRQADDPGEFINANLLFSRRGDLVGQYLKRQPVPFGEYVPFRNLLEFIPQLDSVPQDMVRGDRPVVFELPEGVIGSVISFEGAFARTVRSEVREGAKLLVLASNEGSYGRSEASDQFIGLTRMRAAELGTPIIHGAITGKSTLIDADGSYGEATGLFLKDILIGEVHFRSAGLTVYARLGDWLQVLAIGAGFAAALWPRRRRSPNLFVPPWARPSEPQLLARR